VEETIENAASQIARAGKIVGQLQEFIAHNETSRTVISLHRSLKIAHRGIFRNHEERGFPVELRLVAENCDVFADRAQIGHVLINLLRNAAEARRSDPEHDLVVQHRQTQRIYALKSSRPARNWPNNSNGILTLHLHQGKSAVSSQLFRALAPSLKRTAVNYGRRELGETDF